MAKSDDFDGVAQGDVLTRFRLRAKKSRTQVAVLVGMEADTYRKYETGQTELRQSQIKPFALALGVTPHELVAALGITDDEADPSWSFREALHGQIPAGLIDELACEWEGRGILDQKAAAQAILRMAAKRRTSVTQPQRRNRPA